MELFFLVASLVTIAASGTFASYKLYRHSIATAVTGLLCFVGYGLALWNII